MLNLVFTSVSELRQWLEKRNYESGSPDSFYEWLQKFFDDGNTISIHGEEWDYWACWELI